MPKVEFEVTVRRIETEDGGKLSQSSDTMYQQTFPAERFVLEDLIGLLNKKRRIRRARQSTEA